MRRTALGNASGLASRLIVLSQISFGFSACGSPVDDNGTPGSGAAPNTPPEVSPSPTAGINQDPGTAELPSPISRFARLTHREWQNTVRSLFGPEVSEFQNSFRSDPSQQGFIFDSDANALVVDDALWQAYQRAATGIAAWVAEDPKRIENIAPPATDENARARAFVEQFGLRAHRRPLSESQIQEYLALHARGAEFFPELGSFDAGVRLTLEAFLQSPHFLYRVESSATEVGGVIPLDAYEVASRLSYTLWDNMPDATLFEAAKAETLSDPTAVSLAAKHMLDNEQAAMVLQDFHRQLFRVDRYQGIAPEPSGLAQMAVEEHTRFIRHVAFEKSGTFADLLTSTETFVNATLADLYGLQGEFTDEFVLAQLNSNERAGFLTQIGFLASNANSGVPDPIHRGVFLSKYLACIEIPIPPGEIPPLPAAEGRTNRETVEAHTEVAGSVCVSCHGSVINPFGFPFEYYDGLGRFRTLDNGHPVKGQTSPVLGDTPIVVNSGVELAKALSENQRVHDCYGTHWAEFALGRRIAASDQNLVTRLGRTSLSEGLPVKDLLVALVSSPAFLTRSTEEVQ